MSAGGDGAAGRFFLRPARRGLTKQLLMETPILYVKRGCPYCKTAKDFLDRKQISYREIEVTAAPAEMKNLEKISGQKKTPTLVWDGDVLANFGTEELEPFLAQHSAS